MKIEERPFYYHKFDLGKRKVVFCATCNSRDLFFKSEKLVSVTDISIGMSVCVPWDKYNDERGEEIARGKSLKNPKLEISWNYGEDKYVIESILEGIEKSMRKKPGKYIAGYKKKRGNIAKDIVQK